MQLVLIYKKEYLTWRKCDKNMLFAMVQGKTSQYYSKFTLILCTSSVECSNVKLKFSLILNYMPWYDNKHFGRNRRLENKSEGYSPTVLKVNWTFVCLPLTRIIISVNYKCLYFTRMRNTLAWPHPLATMRDLEP